MNKVCFFIFAENKIGLPTNIFCLILTESPILCFLFFSVYMRNSEVSWNLSSVRWSLVRPGQLKYMYSPSETGTDPRNNVRLYWYILFSCRSHPACFQEGHL